MQVTGLDPQNGRVRWQVRLPTVGGAPYPGMPAYGTISSFQNLIIVPAWDLYALDRTTGAIRWTFHQNDDYPGYGTTVVSNGVVYSVGHDLYAVDAATGGLIYRKSVGEQPFRPTVIDSVIYLATRREIMPGILGNGHALALNTANGTTIWSFAIDDPLDSAGGGSVGPVFVSDSTALVAGETGIVYALDRSSGALRWSYKGAGAYESGVAVIDHTIIVAGDQGSVEGIDFSGRPLWKTAPGSSVTKRITVGDSLALVSVGALFAFDANGQIRWQDGGAGFGGPVYSTAATFRNGVVYIGSVSTESPGAGFYALRLR